MELPGAGHLAIMACMNVSVWELKNHLSEYLRRVQRGERLVVTDRSRPVAELSPIAPSRMSQDEWLTHLEELGDLKRPRRRRRFRVIKPSAIKGKSLSQTILDERR